DLRSAARGVRRAPAFGDVLMRRARVAAAALAGALLAAAMVAGLAAAGAADRIGATFTLMADEFIQAFQPVEGIVVSLDGDEIFLDIGATRGAQVGQEYTIFRKGAPFLHPLTGRPLGRYEDVLGWAQVKRVQPEFASAAKNLDVAGWVVPVLLERRGGVTLDVTYISAITGVALFSRRLPLLPNSAVEEQRFPWEPPVED